MTKRDRQLFPSLKQSLKKQIHRNKVCQLTQLVLSLPSVPGISELTILQAKCSTKALKHPCTVSGKEVTTVTTGVCFSHQHLNNHELFQVLQNAEARLTDQYVPKSALDTVKATTVYRLARWTSRGETRRAVERRGRHTEGLKRNREHIMDPGTLQFYYKTQGHGKIISLDSIHTKPSVLPVSFSDHGNSAPYNQKLFFSATMKQRYLSYSDESLPCTFFNEV